MKRLILQRRAMRDLADARAYYRQEAPHMVSEFALTMDAELRYLRQHAATGSPRYGLLLGIPGLRSWPVKRFPYGIFFFDQDDHIAVVRVLHQARDIPSHLDN